MAAITDSPCAAQEEESHGEEEDLHQEEEAGMPQTILRKPAGQRKRHMAPAGDEEAVEVEAAQVRLKRQRRIASLEALAFHLKSASEASHALLNLMKEASDSD